MSRSESLAPVGPNAAAGATYEANARSQQLARAKADPAWQALLCAARAMIRDATGQDSVAWSEELAAAMHANNYETLTVVKKKKRHGVSLPPTRGAIRLGSSTAGFVVWAY